MSEQNDHRLYKTLSLDADSLALLERYRRQLETLAPGMHISLSAAARAAFYALHDKVK